MQAPLPLRRVVPKFCKTLSMQQTSALVWFLQHHLSQLPPPPSRTRTPKLTVISSPYLFIKLDGDSAVGQFYDIDCLLSHCLHILSHSHSVSVSLSLCLIFILCHSQSASFTLSHSQSLSLSYCLSFSHWHSFLREGYNLWSLLNSFSPWLATP